MSILLNDRYFKKMLNAKKYVIIFLVTSIEVVFEMGIKLWKAGGSVNRHLRVISKLIEFKGFNFKGER